MKAKTKVKRKPDGTFDKGTKAGKMFKPGKSGNPKGRPKDWKQYVREVIEEIEGLEPDSDEYLRAIAKLTWKYAKDGNYPALRDITERLWGKVPDETVMMKKIQVEVVHHIASVIGQAFMMAGYKKEVAHEVITNMQQLLEQQQLLKQGGEVESGE